MYITTRFIGACLILAGLSGCSGTSDYKPSAGLPTDQLFAEACASCHGDKGEGKFGFLLAVAGSEAADEEIVAKILEGGHMMPAFPHISAEQAAAIAGYLKNR